MKVKRFSFIYNHLEEIILVTLFAVMVAAIFMQVVMRYVFQNSLSWSEELGRFVFEWLTWIGLSLGARMGQHIKISLLVDKLPAKIAHLANIASEIIVIVICALTILYGVQIAQMFAGSNYTTMKISLAWGYASVVTGCGLMVIRSLVSMGKSVRDFSKGYHVLSDEKGGAE